MLNEADSKTKDDPKGLTERNRRIKPAQEKTFSAF